MDNKIVSILRSPCCISRLKTGKDRLACLKCNSRYEVKKDRPVLVRSERVGFNKKLLSEEANNTFDFEKNPFVKRFFPPSESLKIVNKEKELLEKLSKNSLTLCIGEKRRETANDRVVYMGINPNDDNDIIADANDLPFQGKSFDLVICRFVLEHLPDPQGVVKQIFRVLKKGGLVYVDMPFLQPFHPAPSDYSRLTLQGLMGRKMVWMSSINFLTFPAKLD